MSAQPSLVDLFLAYVYRMPINAPRYGGGSRPARARSARGNSPGGGLNRWMPQGTTIGQGDCFGTPNCKIKPERYFGGVKKAGTGQTNPTGGRPSGMRKRMATGGKGVPKPNYVFVMKTNPGGKYAPRWRW